MSAYPRAPEHGDHVYLFQNVFGAEEDVASIDAAMNAIVQLLAKGESAINSLLAELSRIDPGQLDQSRLMAAQMALARWQLASQLLSNFLSGLASGLKNTVQNVGR